MGIGDSIFLKWFSPSRFTVTFGQGMRCLILIFTSVLEVTFDEGITWLWPASARLGVQRLFPQSYFLSWLCIACSALVCLIGWFSWQLASVAGTFWWKSISLCRESWWDHDFSKGARPKDIFQWLVITFLALLSPFFIFMSGPVCKLFLVSGSIFVFPAVMVDEQGFFIIILISQLYLCINLVANDSDSGSPSMSWSSMQLEWTFSTSSSFRPSCSWDWTF